MEKETKHISEAKRFSMIARVRSLKHGYRGLKVIFKTQHNSWLQIFSVVLTVLAGYLLKISSIEWILIILAIVIVFFAEAINTAIEIDIDLTSPEFHPYARDTKDVAAGAVMIAMFGAFLIGFIIFIPKIIQILL